tara:strand:+ start:1498 stop:2580 length:1083 start_codon:yes stop_codon:yes gene_type:complete
MKVINARNVNDALLLGIDLFQYAGNYRIQESRNGTTYEALEPVTTVYRNPCERVCLIKQRDANPFFHFIESLWMLAGRNDLKPLTQLVKSMEDFSDDGETLWGAYGWRWNSYFSKDQLNIIIKILKENPEDRRAVLQMWDPIQDLNRQGKDVPCNTNIYFKIREGKLNMTVCNRSNDMLWGAYGANAVHMSILQEYMAFAIGVAVGVYRQISDSFHIYLNPVWDKVKEIEISPYSNIKNPYDTFAPSYEHLALFTNPDILKDELDRFFNMFTWLSLGKMRPSNTDLTAGLWENPAIKNIAIPMIGAYFSYKEKDFKSSYKMLNLIKALDWRKACLDWIRKREKSFIKKPEKTVYSFWRKK